MSIGREPNRYDLRRHAGAQRRARREREARERDAGRATRLAVPDREAGAAATEDAGGQSAQNEEHP